jgi:hypothetical protein
MFRGKGIVCERWSCCGCGASRIGDAVFSLTDKSGSLSSWILLLWLLRTFSFALSASAGREAFRGGRTAIDGLLAVDFALWAILSCGINGAIIVGVALGFADASASVDGLTAS